MITTMIRYVGDVGVLEYGRVYNCKISVFGRDPTNCSITVEVRDPSKGLIATQMLYSSMADYFMDWKPT